MKNSVNMTRTIQRIISEEWKTDPDKWSMMAENSSGQKINPKTDRSKPKKGRSKFQV